MSSNETDFSIAVKFGDLLGLDNLFCEAKILDQVSLAWFYSVQQNYYSDNSDSPGI